MFKTIWYVLAPNTSILQLNRLLQLLAHVHTGTAQSRMLHVRRKHPEEYDRIKTEKETPQADAASCAVGDEVQRWCECCGDINGAAVVNFTNDTSTRHLNAKNSIAIVAPLNYSAMVVVLPCFAALGALDSAFAPTEQSEYKMLVSRAHHTLHAAAKRTFQELIDARQGHEHIPLVWGVPFSFDYIMVPTASTIWHLHKDCEAFSDIPVLSLDIGAQLHCAVVLPGQIVCRIDHRQIGIEWQYMNDTLDTNDIRRVVISFSQIDKLGLTALLDGSVMLTIQPRRNAKLRVEQAARTNTGDGGNASWQWRTCDAVDTTKAQRHVARFAAGALDLAWTMLLARSKLVRRLASTPLVDIYVGQPAALLSSTSESRVSQT